MIVTDAVQIRGSRGAVWALVTDIENAARTIRGIEKIEIVERPATGLVGLRWRETRLLFDELATVEKRITHAVEGASYRTRAESDGFVFVTTTALADANGVVTLTSTHDSQPQTLKARLMTIPMRLFFRGVIRKAIRKDLEDVRTAIESAAG